MGYHGIADRRKFPCTTALTWTDVHFCTCNKFDWLRPNERSALRRVTLQHVFAGRATLQHAFDWPTTKGHYCCGVLTLLRYVPNQRFP